MACWWAGGWLTGAGLFTPFKRAWTGIVVALAIQFLYLVFVPAVNWESLTTDQPPPYHEKLLVILAGCFVAFFVLSVLFYVFTTAS
jgi:hypothetical protein